MSVYEIDITDLFNNANTWLYSGSVATHGNNVARETWEAAKQAPYTLLRTEEQRAQFRKYISEFGAWSDTEIAAMTGVELNALLIQMISADMREAAVSDDGSLDWDDYQKQCEDGQVSGNLYKGTGGKIYYTIYD